MSSVPPSQCQGGPDKFCSPLLSRAVPCHTCAGASARRGVRVEGNLLGSPETLSPTYLSHCSALYSLATLLKSSCS